jgi:nucleolar protein 14
VFIDKRLAQASSKFSEDEKMRLRYLREQRDMIKHRQTTITKRRAKYNLEEEIDSEGDN